MLRIAQFVATYVVAVVGVCEDGSCKEEVPIDLLQSRVEVELSSDGAITEPSDTFGSAQGQSMPPASEPLTTTTPYQRTCLSTSCHGPPLDSAYEPKHGWGYRLVPDREGCSTRYLSTSEDGKIIDFYDQRGDRQEFTLEAVGGSNRTFYLKTGMSLYLSVVYETEDDCQTDLVDSYDAKGSNQQFRFVDARHCGDWPCVAMLTYDWYLEAVGRQTCAKRYIAFDQTCSTRVFLQDQENAGVLRIHPVNGISLPVHEPAIIGEQDQCGDPFVWESKYDNHMEGDKGGQFALACTGGLIAIRTAEELTVTTKFDGFLWALPDVSANDTAPKWTKNVHRWAPEIFEFGSHESRLSVLFFSSPDSNEWVDPEDHGTQRIGWAIGNQGLHWDQWNIFAAQQLDLGQPSGGEIDAHVFQDDDGKTYLVWKSDDNHIDEVNTRLWAQEIALSSHDVQLIGNRILLLHSKDVQSWWVDSFIEDGKLIEGPEILKKDNYYYLFFATGRYCGGSYTESVARATSLGGPYELAPVPLLAPGMVGTMRWDGLPGHGKRLVGTGHAAFLQSNGSEYYAIWHAFPLGDGETVDSSDFTNCKCGAECVRRPYISRMVFENGWPVLIFTS